MPADQKYLRLRNTSDQELYLSDLDDESNNTESTKMQVYLDAGEVADVPVDAEVVHSYEKGTIAGFVDDGLLEASPYEEGSSNKLWVSADGHDSNPGTYSAPLASIQTAIDRLDEEIPIEQPKRVLVTPGTYQENLFINTRNIVVRGVASENTTFPFGDTAIRIQEDDPALPICTITNMTEASWETFQSEGGVDYEWDAQNADYTYTGAPLTEREINAQGVDSRVRWSISFENFHLERTETTPDNVVEDLCVLGASSKTTFEFTDPLLEKVTIKKILHSFEGFSIPDSDLSSFWKNTIYSDITEVAYSGSGGVFDSCTNISPVPSGGSAAGITLYSNRLIYHSGDNNLNNTALDGSTEIDFYVSSSDTSIFFTGAATIGDTNGRTISAGAGSFELNTTSDLNTGSDTPPPDLKTNQFTHGNTGSASFGTLECSTGISRSTGLFDAKTLICQQSFTFNDGNGVVRSGHVGGNLIVEGGCVAKLSELTIEGDLIIRGSGTQVSSRGVHVQGAVQLETTVDTQQDFYGGSIIGDGHTNAIRDENGSDQSADANWNRVSGV